VDKLLKKPQCNLNVPPRISAPLPPVMVANLVDEVKEEESLEDEESAFEGDRHH